MKLLSIRAIDARNIYAHFPVIRMVVDLEELKDVASNEIPAFNQKLLEQLPGIGMHKCSKGYEGGFAERLTTGTYMAHVIEHAALEIQNMLGYPVKYGKARWDSGESIYCLVYSYYDPEIGMEAGKLAFELIRSLAGNENFDLQPRLVELKEQKQKRIDSNHDILSEAASRQNIPLMQPFENGYLQLGYGAKQIRILSATPENTGCLATDIAADSETVRALLKVQHIPVYEPDPESMKEPAALRVVCKSENGWPALIQDLSVEKKDYNSEKEVIALREGEQVVAVYVCNGEALCSASVNEEGIAPVILHQSFLSLSCEAAATIGLKNGLVSWVCTDITKDPLVTGGKVISVSSDPLLQPLTKKGFRSFRVTEKIINCLVPDPAEVQIPLVSITGTNGKTTTTRMVGSIFREAGHHVGMTCTDGVYIGGRKITSGDCTGPASARTVLSSRSVTAAVLETARGGMIRRGLGYDLADVGVVTNISGDHVGSDGLQSAADVARAKALVIEAVKPGGKVVLNAMDDFCSFMLSRTEEEVILFSADENHPQFKKHLSKGGRGLSVKNQTVCLYTKESVSPIIPLRNIPATAGGLIGYNVENALAAIAASVAAGISMKFIRQGLESFGGDEMNNPGRFNCFRYGDVHIVLDYGHNPEGYRSVLKAISRMAEGRLTGVIGVPGDREDRMIREAGRIAAEHFDRLIIKEDADLRGRKPGEVARLLLEGAEASGTRTFFTDYVADEGDALRKAIQLSKPGEWIVVFFEDFAKVRDVVRDLPGAVSVTLTAQNTIQSNQAATVS